MMAKPATKNLRKTSTLAEYCDTVSKSETGTKGKPYFTVLHHQLGNIFVSDTVFNTKEERLTVYISTLMSQFFTSTTFYNTEFDKNIILTQSPRQGKRDRVLFEWITGMGIIDIYRIHRCEQFDDVASRCWLLLFLRAQICNPSELEVVDTKQIIYENQDKDCLLYTSPSPRDQA
eukprot:TRINITY_DN5068_c0_g1_i3.p1 TRINITY_DN5068_c0_g1~~TRINITY_DN5068_c0_g1_i3.p1  ORF type:complete len:175 (+),score=23.10 TRINITY_DN5068_c0_g1_i3:962-1486(+)